jgi:hypothetical protein
MTKPNVKRSGERLIRLAYDLEALAARLRLAGYESEANGVHHIARQSGNIGRELDRKVRPPCP